MKKAGLLWVLLFFWVTVNAQQLSAGYGMFEISVRFGLYKGSGISYTHVFPNRFFLQSGYAFLHRPAQNLPDDFEGCPPRDLLQSFELTAGKLFPLNAFGTFGFHLGGGFSINRFSVRENFSYVQRGFKDDSVNSFLGLDGGSSCRSNYTSDAGNYLRPGLIFNPGLYFRFYRKWSMGLTSGVHYADRRFLFYLQTGIVYSPAIKKKEDGPGRKETGKPSSTRNSIFVSIGNGASLYSLQYDRVFGPALRHFWVSGAGLGFAKFRGKSVAVCALSLTKAFNFSGANHFIETGAGVSYALHGPAFLYPVLGYRYHRRYKPYGFHFKLTATYPSNEVEDYFPLPSISFSVGFGF